MLSKAICWCNLKYRYILLYANYKGTKKSIGTCYIVKLYIISVQQGFLLIMKWDIKNLSVHANISTYNIGT